MLIYCFIKYTDDPGILNTLKIVPKNENPVENTTKTDKSIIEIKAYPRKSRISSASVINPTNLKEIKEHKKSTVNLEPNGKSSLRTKSGGKSSNIRTASDKCINEDETKWRSSMEYPLKLEKTSEISRGSLAVKKHKILGPNVDNQFVNKVMRVNPDCYVQILLDFIYDELKIDKSLKIDLADDTGILIKIDLLQQHDSAKTFLQHKKTYIPVVFERDDNGDYSRLTPVLKKITKQDTDFFIRLLKNANSSNRLSQKSQKSSQSLKSARGLSGRTKSTAVNNTPLNSARKRLQSL